MLELNKIYNMDCLEGMKLLPDDSIDVIITSPPYWKGFEYEAYFNSYKQYLDWCECWLKECKRVLKPNGTKIFEGDIIKHIRTLWGKDNSDIGVILWCENLCKFYRTLKFDTMDKVEIWKDTAVDYEVIGNIHDNLELIENEV